VRIVKATGSGQPTFVQREESAALRSMARITYWTWEAVSERRARVAPVLRLRCQEVVELVDEGVLVAQAVTGRPPGTQEGMCGLGDEDPAESRFRFRVGRVVQQELIH
jgi:hypothetical protein